METVKEIASEIVAALETLGRAIEDYNDLSTGDKYAAVVTIKTLAADSETPLSPVQPSVSSDRSRPAIRRNTWMALDGDTGFDTSEPPQLCCPPGTSPVRVTCGSKNYLVCQ